MHAFWRNALHCALVTENTTQRQKQGVGRPRLYPSLPGESAEERRRRIDRERLAAKRAEMTPEQRREQRREHDRLYRERHPGRTR